MAKCGRPVGSGTVGWTEKQVWMPDVFNAMLFTAYTLILVAFAYLMTNTNMGSDFVELVKQLSMFIAFAIQAIVIVGGFAILSLAIIFSIYSIIVSLCSTERLKVIKK